MPTGHHKEDPPAHGNHMHNFDLALNDALSQWHGNADEQLTMTLSLIASPNPGGVKEYIVNLQSGGH